MVLELLAGVAGGLLAADRLFSKRVSRLEQRTAALEKALDTLRRQVPPGDAAAPATVAGALPAAAPSPVSPVAPMPTPTGVATSVAGAATAAGMAVAEDAVSTRASPAPMPARKPPGIPGTPPAPARPAAAAPRLPRAVEGALLGLRALVMANPFASAGVLLVLVSLGFLFTLLDLRRILPPELRVAAVALAATGLFALGLRQERDRPPLGLNLQGGALAAHYLCALWAFQGYGLVSAATALAWMGLLSSAAVGWAVLRGRVLFAFMGLAGALLTPLLADTRQGDFAGLALYAAWVSAMSLGAALRLDRPALGGAALAGVAALLGLVPGLPAGSPLLLTGALLAMQGGFQAAALRWAARGHPADPARLAVVVGLLLAAPTLFAALLQSRLHWTDAGTSALLGGSALLYLTALARLAAPWRPWLLFLGTVLGACAIGIGLEGATRAMAFSAATLGLALLGRAPAPAWAPWLALGCWGLSLLTGLDALWAHGQHLPLLLSAAVALAAGWAGRDLPVATAYALGAPLAAFAALDPPPEVLLARSTTFFSAWAVAAAGLQWTLRRRAAPGWPALALSGVWALPAGLGLLLAGSIPEATGALLVREATLAAWAVATACWVLAVRSEPRFGLAPANESLLQALTLAVPVAASLEMLRVAGPHGLRAWLPGGLALLWAGWASLARLAQARTGRGFLPGVAAAVAAVLLLGTALVLAPRAEHLLAWPAVGLLLLSAWRWDAPATDRQLAAAVAATAAIAQLLQLFGRFEGLRRPTLALLAERAMQPWVSLLWAAAGIAVVAQGARAGSARLWRAGGFAIALLVAKMLLVDLDALSLAAKVGVFLVTGVALILLGRFSPAPPPERPEGR